ncbi:RDD family protein [Natrinema versiforme]|uniref:RDD family protein n=1 Tax=Natrinema versiforme TaxID=88724 RepID=A0A4V1FZV2_9EURY|nr:RDD family protein [Natrinema versiforme]QCS43136.1 RDD family protein [Natrinema versiforme]
MAKLRIFGSIHPNTRGVVEDDLREFSRGADAIAVEHPRLGETARSAVALVLRYPFLFVGLQLVFLFQMPLYALFNRDLRSTESLAAQAVAGERPVHEVDRHPLAILEDRSPGWLVANWVAFLALAIAYPAETFVAAGLAVGLLAIVTVRSRYGVRRPMVVAAVVLTAVGCGLVAVDLFRTDIGSSFVALSYLVGGIGLIRYTLEARNEAMLEDIATLAATHDYERICLTTGYAHLPGLVERAADHGLTTVDIFKPRWRASGEMVDPEAVLASDDHDVRPDMEAAGNVLGRRVVATVIDLLVLALIALAGPVVIVGIDSAHSIGGDAVFSAFTLCWWLLSPPAYYVIGEAIYGQTVGKSILDLTVVRIDGSPCTVRDAVVRTTVRPLDFLPAGYFLGGVIAAVTDYGQRLGDLAAGTTVVKLTEANTGSSTAAARSADDRRAGPAVDRPVGADETEQTPTARRKP